MNQHPRNQHFLMALMQDLEEASTALKEHRETLETATSEAEARHQWFSMFNLFGFDKHPTPFWMVAPSNAPSLGFRGLTQPKQNIKITSSNKIGIVTLDVSKATNNCWAPGSIIAAGARLPGQGQELHRQAQECCSDSEEEYCDLIWLYDVLKSFRTHVSNKLYNLYMCSWGSGINSKVSQTPGLHTSWSRRMKSDRCERFWVGFLSGDVDAAWSCSGIVDTYGDFERSGHAAKIYMFPHQDGKVCCATWLTFMMSKILHF